MRFGFILFLILISIISCEKKELVPKPDNLLDEDTFVKLMVEIQLLDVWIYTSEEVPNPDSLKGVLFNEYNTSEEIFDISNAYYQSNTDEHIARIDSALKLIEEEQKRLQPSSSN